METKITKGPKEVVISRNKHTVLIGERLNPTGRKKLAEALKKGDLSLLREEAIAQVQSGADVLDVNVGVAGLDEVSLMEDTVHLLMEIEDVPLCIDSKSAKTLEAGLKVYDGKPLINSINGEERSLEEILPLVKEYDAAVIALPTDENGISNEPEERLKITQKILERADTIGISKHDVVVDCLAMTVGAESRAGIVTLETIRLIRKEFNVNLTLGVSNVSFGLPDRDLINGSFLGLAIAAGVNCPIVDVAKALPIARACDLLLDRDKYAMRYTKAYRNRINSE